MRRARLEITGGLRHALPVAKQLYLSLFRELNASRFDSEATSSALAQLGAPARLLRGYALARRRAYASAARDLLAAVAEPGVPALIELVAGVGLFVCRRYSEALAALGRAASKGKPGVAKQARKLAVDFSEQLCWFDDGREPLAALGVDTRAQAEARARELASSPPEQIAERSAELLRLDGSTALAEALEAARGEAPSVEWARARLNLHMLLDERDEAEALLARLGPELGEQLDVERAALALSQGDAKAVMVRTSHHRGDPQLLYLRGQALLLLGELREGCDKLERARAAAPDSIPLLLTLAVARNVERPDTRAEGLERRFEELLELAPGLLSDAARSAGVELWTDRGPTQDRELAVAVLRRARGLLTGEQAIRGPHYVGKSAGGRLVLRSLAPPADAGEPSHLERLHQHDRRRLDQTEGALVRALGVSPPPPPPQESRRDSAKPRAAEPWTPRFLSPEQIEQFLEDGFFVIEGAFDRELAERWRLDGIRRIREEPERWVRGYNPNVPARRLDDFSPDDPSTWTWPRIDLLGEESMAIEDFSPEGWAAICDLLGGPERIETRSWNNYLIVNVNAHAHLDVPGPAPDWDSWHIDDPNPATRLDAIKNGLVCVALFSDLLPRSGNTWLAPDSVGRVARKLAQHPEGYDFCADRGEHITMECERFHEVTGKAGDLLMMHPLMMHSSSPNPSGRIRWMGNPMVYMREPLDPFRPEAELSPVELAIRRAIDVDRP